MEESRLSPEVKGENEGRGLLAYFYGDVLVKAMIHGETRLAYKEERDKIRYVLKESGRKIRFWSERATVQSVRSRLTSGCQILHFTGYGDAESLEFESERHCGKAEKLMRNDLWPLIGAGGIVPDLVFLESCDPEMCGWAVTVAGVPHVVAVKWKVPDGTTRDFAACFYNELIANNLTVQKAFDIAVSSVEANEPTAAKTFLLLPKDDSHEVQIFNGLRKGSFIDETPQLPQYFNLPPEGKACTERVQLRNLLSLLEDKDTNCVTITGEPGIGKTEIALRACHYMGERNQFSAIFFADCRKATGHSYSFPTSGRPEAHIQHLCRLVGLALGTSQDISFPKDLVAYLKRKSGHESPEPTHQDIPSHKILLVLDAVNAVVEGGGIEARRSLADFADALCCNMSNLKLLLTSEQELLGLTGHCLSNSSEKVFPLRKNDPEAKSKGTSFPSQGKVNPLDIFSKRAKEISEAMIPDESCRNIWLKAILEAEEDGVTKSHDDDACYRHVPWGYLSSAFNKDCSQSEGSSSSPRDVGNFFRLSSDNEFSGSFSARELNEGELDFIRNLLRNSLKMDDKDNDGGKYGAERRNGSISTGYGYPGKYDGHEWISLKAFARFSRGWLGPVIATLSKMQNDSAANDPVNVHEFISNDKARNQLLKTSQSGVFMLRFSVSNPGRLLLAVTRKAARNASTGDAPRTLYIEQSPVTVREDGKWIVGKGRSRRTFNSLHELVQGKRSLETLYPDIPKGDVFPITSPTVSSNISLATVE